MLTYPIFYRQHGIRLFQQMMKPPMTPITNLYLPIGSIYHYISSDTQEIGLPESDEVISNVKGMVLVDHVTEIVLADALGKPHQKPLNVNATLMDYHHHHKRFKRLSQNTSMIKNERLLAAVSYNLIARHYRYMENAQTAYCQWHNLYHAVWAKAGHMARENAERHQYIPIHVPTVLPSLSYLNNAKVRTDRVTMKRFNTDTLRFVLDLWDWAGPHRDQSLLSTLSIEEIQRINLLVFSGGMWTTINLGVLDSWRMSNESDHKGPGGVMKIPPARMQLRLLRMLMAIAETTSVRADHPDHDHMQASEPVPTEPNHDDSVEPRKPVDIHDYDVGFKMQAADKEQTPGKSHVVKQTLVEIIKSGAAPTTAKNDEELLEELPDLSDEDIEKDLKALEKVNEELEDHEELAEHYHAYTPHPRDHASGVRRRAEELARKGLMTAAELRRMDRIANRFKEIKNPYGGDGNLEAVSTIAKESLHVAERTPLAEAIAGVTDSSMLSSSLKHFDNKYIREVLPKDLVNVSLHLQRAGVAVQDYTVTKVDDYMDSFDVHAIKLVPVVGKPSTIRIQVPRVNEDGTFLAGGVKYRMRKQRGDVPIRKTGPDTVALTSYYSKMFVVRSDRAVFNYTNWLVNNLVGIGVDPANDAVMDLRLSNVYYHDVKVPRAYSTIAQRVDGFRSGRFSFFFDYHKRHDNFGENVLKVLEPQGKYVAVGIAKDGYVVMDFDDKLFFVSKEGQGKGMQPLGTIDELIGLPLDKRPVEVAEVDIFGKTIPVGFLLACHIGLGNLLKTLDVKPRRVRIGSNYNLQPDEFIVKFEDEALVFHRKDRIAALLMNGFNRYHREIKHYSVYDFDKKDAFGSVLEDNDIGARWLREFDLMFNMWVDHITHDLLVEMHEPTDLFNLFIKCCEYLTTDHHPAEGDSDFTRDKGYERFAGLAYFELVKAMRAYNAKPINANASVDLNPQAVWMSILQDQTVMPIEESNPVHSLKEQEVVVFSGSGGRSGRSMTGKSRVYHKSNMGLVSEATVDSGDVATITYLTADPNYNSLRGTSRRLQTVNGNAAKLISTSFMNAPGADHDDPKRICFVSIQNSQTTHAHGYTPAPMRTGYERVLAHRTNSLYAKTARTDGVVEALTDNSISVKYKDGDVQHYEIGRRFGTWAGHVTPHDIVTPLKQGSKVKAGDVLIYNERYFTPDHLDPSQVILKMSTMATVVLWESTSTLEDSCELSKSIAHRMRTDTTHVRNIKVSFNQEIRNLVDKGEALGLESILCTIHNATSGNNDIFDDAAMNTLNQLAATSPKAGVTGHLDRIEVLYTGELEDMSNSLRQLAERSDQAIRQLNKRLGRKAVDGRVDVGYRVDGHPLELDAAVIRLYITGPTDMGVGDKGVIANQAKTVVGGVVEGTFETEDGQPLDVCFGYQSLANRIVLSAEIMGTTNALLIETGKRAVAAYRSK